MVREAEFGSQRDETGADGERGDSNDFPETAVSTCCSLRGGFKVQEQGSPSCHRAVRQ